MNKFDQTYNEILNILNEENDAYALNSFDYRMLSRLQSDCKYFINDGYGYGCEKHLWANSVEAQIEKMKEIYDRLPEKPVWCTMDDILAYEEAMKEIKANKENARDLQKFEFCIQMKDDLKTFKFINIESETGDEAYKKVMETYPNWRVFSWNRVTEFEETPDKEIERL